MSDVRIKVTPKLLTVKLVALRGLPAQPTQEQINTAVTEYMDDHPEAQIPDGAVSTAKIADDAVTTDKIDDDAVTTNKVEDEAITTEKMASNTVAPYADNLVSSSYVSDSEPYLIRKTFAGVREDTEIVGGTVVWNQLEQGRTGSNTAYGITFSYSDGLWTFSGTCTQTNIAFRLSDNNKPIQTGHKILLTNTSSTFKVRLQGFFPSTLASTPRERILQARDGAVNDIVVMGFNMDGVAVNENDSFGIIDLTLMFGPTVADYIYSLEQATAGAGVAFFRSLFSKPYYAYNAGTLMSVKTSAHKMVGFNQWDEEWENGDISTVTGQNGSDIRRIRSKNYCPTIPNAIYSGYMAESAIKYINIFWYDADKSLIKYNGIRLNGNQTVTAPDGASYFRILTQQAYGTTYLDDICINLSDPSKNGTYEPYTAHTYPLDSSLTLRGLPTIVDGKLKYDGDVYKSDGTVTRLYGYRAYQSGDESLANAITDGTHTVYKLTTATTETADPFVNPQVCYPDGTEEYIDAREVPIPVGHNTKYMRDLKKLLEGIPDAPTANGTYVLKATVSSSGVTYAWIAG